MRRAVALAAAVLALVVGTAAPAAAVLELGPVEGYDLPATWSEVLEDQPRAAVGEGDTIILRSTTVGSGAGDNSQAWVSIWLVPHEELPSPEAWAAQFSPSLQPDASAAGGTAVDHEILQDAGSAYEQSGIDGVRWVGELRQTVSFGTTDPDPSDGVAPVGTAPTASTTYWEQILVPTGEVDVRIRVYVFGQAPDALPQTIEDAYRTGVAEAQGVRGSIRITAPGATGGTRTTADPPGGPDEDGGRWRVIVGSLGALAAAAAAIAAIAGRSTPDEREGRGDPNALVGYVLQLSTRRMAPLLNSSTPLKASVWQVRASGALEPATGATITFAAPRNVEVQPASGASSVETMVWRTGAVAPQGFITVTARTSTGGTTGRVELIGGSTRLAVDLEPPDKAELLPDGRDSVTIVASIVLSEADRAAGMDLGAAAATIRFGEPSPWGRTSPPVPWGTGGRAVTLAAGSPDPAGNPRPPDQVELVVTAQVGGQALREQVSVPLAVPATLEVDPDEVRAALGSGAAAKLETWVDHPGPARWELTASWVDPDRPPARIEVAAQAGQPRATITLTEAAPGDDPSGSARGEVVGTLRIRATAPGREPLERDVRYVVVREGLFVDTISAGGDGLFHIVADGRRRRKPIDFRIMVKDPATGEIRSDPARAGDLTFESGAPEGTPERNLYDFSKLTWRFMGVRQEQSPAAMWQFWAERDCPGRGGEMTVRVVAAVPGLDPDRYSCLVPFGYELSSSPTPSDLIEVERQRTLDIINTFAPPRLRDDLREMLAAYDVRFGPEGLAQLRREIWQKAADGVLKEGEDALDEAWWLDWEIYGLDWCTWMGDLAFGALVNSYFGAWYGTVPAMVITATKPMLISALNAYRLGQSPEAWAEEQIWSILYIFEGRTVDVDRFAQLTSMSRAKCWALFCTYHFFKSLYQQPKKSILQAIKDTAWQVTDNMIAQWLGGKVNAAMIAGGHIPPPPGHAPVDEGEARRQAEAELDQRRATDEEAARQRIEDEAGQRRADDVELTQEQRRAAQQVSDDVLAKAVERDGRLVLDPDDALAIMRDPERARLLKQGGDPRAREAFASARREIYAPHDTALEGYVGGLLGVDPRNVKVQEVSTPGRETSFSVDRDYTVTVRVTNTDGSSTWVEVPRQCWVQQSQLEFARLTGGPGDTATPEARRQHAEDHQMRAMDVGDAEASPDFSRYRVDRSSGRATFVTMDEPHIETVKRGEGTLISPETLGSMFEHKVTDALKGDTARTGLVGEAFVQANKGVEQLEQVRTGYAERNPARFDVGELPPEFQEGARAVRQAAANFADPDVVAAADRRLRELHFDGVEGFSKALNSQTHALKWAKPTVAPPAPPT